MTEKNILENGPDKPFLCCCQEQLNMEISAWSSRVYLNLWGGIDFPPGGNYLKIIQKLSLYPRLLRTAFISDKVCNPVPSQKSLWYLEDYVFQRLWGRTGNRPHISVQFSIPVSTYSKPYTFQEAEKLWPSLFLFPMLLSEMSRKLEVPTPLPNQTYRIDVYPHGSLGLAARRRLWDCGRDRDRERGELNASLQAGGLHQRSVGW